MRVFTKGRELSEKEQKIIAAINSGDSAYSDAFYSLYNYFKMGHAFQKSGILHTFKAIYIDKLDTEKNIAYWKIQDLCHISKSTFYNYRHIILDYFETYIKENFTISEVAITKDKL